MADIDWGMAIDQYEHGYGEEGSGSYGWGEKRCKFCGKGFLRWEQRDDRWVLVNGRGETHKCIKPQGTTSP